MRKFLAVIVLSLGLMSCGVTNKVIECSKFKALEGMLQNNEDEAIDEQKVLSAIRKLALKIEGRENLPNEPEIVNARKYCKKLLIVD